MTATTIFVTGFLGAGKSTLALRMREALGPGCTVAEADGRADPALDPALDLVTTGATDTAIVAVADAANVAACLDDPLIGPLVAAQLRAAALVALARTDLVPEAPARRVVATITDAPVVVARQGTLPPEILGRLTMLPPHRMAAGPRVCVRFAEWRYDGPAVVRAEPLKRLVAERVPGLWRLSGLVRGRKGGVEVQLAGRVRQTQAIAAPAETRLTAIGPAERFRPDDMALRFSEAVAASAHLSGIFGYR